MRPPALRTVFVAFARAASMLAVACGAGSLVLPTADAQVAPLRLYAEPFSYTDVPDAFDDHDPFDIDVTVGFSRSVTAGTIQREGPNTDGRASASYVDIADHEHIVNQLEVEVAAGLFHDLALTLRLPIILSDDRELTFPDGVDPAAVTGQLARGGADGALFSVPFRSPTRSGFDYLGVGFEWSIFNQHRAPQYPTWVLLGEARINLGDPIVPCEAGRTCDSGASEGTVGLRLETRASWRHRYWEPYTGLSFQADLPAGAVDNFEPAGAIPGYLNTIPPIVGELTAGIALIPWEQRARWQRFAIDLRMTGAYVSEGRGYSPLFDALGMSEDTAIATPKPEIAGCTGDGCGRLTPFNGLTDMEAHGRLRARVALEMQAARYVRFTVGTAFAYTTPHDITYADACNPNVSVGADDPRRGDCRRGIINPHHRGAIDLPGQRFRVNGELTYDVFVSVTGQF